MKRLLISVLAALAATGAFAQVADGDLQWAARAEGHQAGHAQPAHIDAAIAAYQRAIAANPNDLEARWKLLRAFRFKGAYVAKSTDEQKQIYSAAKTAGEAAMVIVNRRLKEKGIALVDKATEKRVADAARGIPGAGEVFNWDAVNWGEWALVYGKMAAVKEGAADRIKREATIALLADPKIEGGSPGRVLGRLHDQTPHIPFITGWASSKEAVKFLSDSLKIDPTNKVTKVFLAEALVNNDSDNKAHAVQMLKEVNSSPNDPLYEVEQARAQEDARELLKKWNS